MLEIHYVWSFPGHSCNPVEDWLKEGSMNMNRHSDFADLQETSSRQVANIRTTFSSKSVFDPVFCLDDKTSQ